MGIERISPLADGLCIGLTGTHPASSKLGGLWVPAWVMLVCVYLVVMVTFLPHSCSVILLVLMGLGTFVSFKASLKS